MLGGKTAIVTGAAGDLGNAMALQLAANGAHVVMWDIVPRAEAAEAIKRVQEHDAAAQYAEVDVRDRAAVDEEIASLSSWTEYRLLQRRHRRGAAPFSS